MATDSLDDEVLLDLNTLVGYFDDETSEILMKFDALNKAVFESELVERCDKDQLRILRDRIFELSKDKIVLDLGDKDATKLLDDEMLASIDQSKPLAEHISQWEAVNRRAKHKLASDTFHFLCYLLGHSPRFPTKLLREISLDKGCIGNDTLPNDLENLFLQDLCKAAGPVDVTILHSEETREQHLVTFPCGTVTPEVSPNVPATQPVTAVAKVIDPVLTNDENDQSNGTAQGNPIADSTPEAHHDIQQDTPLTVQPSTPVSSVTVPANPASEYTSELNDSFSSVETVSALSADSSVTTSASGIPSSIPNPPTGCRGICGNCGAAVLLWECMNSRGLQTSHDERAEMAGNMRKKAPDSNTVSRRDFDFHVEYSDRKFQEVVNKVDEIMGWKSTVQAQVNNVEEAFFHNEALHLAQQREICERLEQMRLIDIEKENERQEYGGARPKTYRPPTTPQVSQQVRPPVNPVDYESIWDIEPAQLPPRQQPEQRPPRDRALYSRVAASTPKLDPKEAMAGAKQLARKAIMSDTLPPVPKPQRTPGVAFFTPSPAHDPRSRRDATRNPDTSRTKVDMGQRGASAPSGLRKAAHDKGNVSRVNNSRSTVVAKQGTTPRNDTGPIPTDYPRHHEVHNIDTTGMSDSWYEGDSENDAEIDNHGGGDIHRAVIDNHGGGDTHRAEIDNHGGGDTHRAEIDNHGGGDTHRAEIDNHGGGDTHRAEIDNHGGGDTHRAEIDNHGGGDTHRTEIDNHGGGERRNAAAYKTGGGDTPEDAIDITGGAAAPAPLPPAKSNTKQSRRDTRRNNNNKKAPVNDQGEFRYYFGGNTGRDDNAIPSNGRVVTRSGWKTPENKKRKRERSGARAVPPLRAAVPTIRRELYVQGLDYSECSCHADFEDMVVEFCNRQGVKILGACTIPKGKSRVEAGCKVTVRECDYLRLSDPDFWPGDSTVRPWTQRPRGGRRENDVSDTSE